MPISPKKLLWMLFFQSSLVYGILCPDYQKTLDTIRDRAANQLSVEEFLQSLPDTLGYIILKDKRMAGEFMMAEADISRPNYDRAYVEILKRIYQALQNSQSDTPSQYDPKQYRAWRKWIIDGAEAYYAYESRNPSEYPVPFPFIPRHFFQNIYQHWNLHPNNIGITLFGETQLTNGKIVKALSVITASDFDIGQAVKRRGIRSQYTGRGAALSERIPIELDCIPNGDVYLTSRNKIMNYKTKNTNGEYKIVTLPSSPLRGTAITFVLEVP